MHYLFNLKNLISRHEPQCVRKGQPVDRGSQEEMDWTVSALIQLPPLPLPSGCCARPGVICHYFVSISGAVLCVQQKHAWGRGCCVFCFQTQQLLPSAAEEVRWAHVCLQEQRWQWTCEDERPAPASRRQTASSKTSCLFGLKRSSHAGCLLSPVFIFNWCYDI